MSERGENVEMGICSFCGREVAAEELTEVEFRFSEGDSKRACPVVCFTAATHYWYKKVV